jgi:hypothetical protein
VTSQVVAQQRQAMKKAGALTSGKKRDRPPGTTQAAKQPPSASLAASPVDLIDKTIDLAQQCGGVARLRSSSIGRRKCKAHNAFASLLALTKSPLFSDHPLLPPAIAQLPIPAYNQTSG